MKMLAPTTNLVIEIAHDLASVKDRWMAIQERALATPFQTWEWCARLFDTVGRVRGAQPLVVILRKGASGEDIALLPLALERRHGLRVIGFADFGLGDYAMPVFIPDEMFQIGTIREIWPKIIASLPPVDLIHFDKMPAGFGGVVNPLSGLPGLMSADLDCWRTYLPDRWEDYEQALSKQSRRAIRRRAAKLDRLGTSRLEFLSGGEETGRMLDLLHQVRRVRFSKLGRMDVMDDPAVRAFYRGLATDESGKLPLMSVLRLNDEIVALVFGLLKDNQFYMLAMTFVHGRPELEKCAPALVLVHRMMHELHARGLQVYDFTIGAESYKRSFGARREPLYEYLQPLTAKGHLFVAARRLQRAARSLQRKGRSWLARRHENHRKGKSNGHGARTSRSA